MWDSCYGQYREKISLIREEHYKMLAHEDLKKARLPIFANIMC